MIRETSTFDATNIVTEKVNSFQIQSNKINEGEYEKLEKSNLKASKWIKRYFIPFL